MIKKRKKSEILETLNKLNTTDVYSMLLFVLYKLKDNPQYSTLSELCYVLDNDNLSKFLAYFGGTTIQVPKLYEFRAVIQAMMLYDYVNLKNGDLQEGISVVCDKEFKQDFIMDLYLKICEVAKDYDFSRED